MTAEQLFRDLGFDGPCLWLVLALYEANDRLRGLPAAGAVELHYHGSSVTLFSRVPFGKQTREELAAQTVSDALLHTLTDRLPDLDGVAHDQRGPCDVSSKPSV